MTPKQLEQKIFRKKITEKKLPVEVEEIFPEAYSIYERLLEKERQLDLRLVKKQLDIQEASFKTFKVKKNIKIFASSSFVVEVASKTDAADAATKIDVFWNVRIDGRVADVSLPATTTMAGVNARNAQANAAANVPTQKKFSNYLKSLYVELDALKYPQDGLIEWTKVPMSAETDGFEIKRRLTHNLMGTDGTEVQRFTLAVPIKIFAQFDWGQEKFRLSAPLAAVLARDIDSKPNIIMGLWQYIKLHKLQDADDRRCVCCDAALQRVFGAAKIAFAAIPEHIVRHIGPVPPVALDYTLLLPVEYTPSTRSAVACTPPHNKTLLYAATIDVDEHTRFKLPTLLSAAASTKEVAMLEQRMSETLSRIYAACLKREFLRRFAEQPAAFIQKWVVSQAKDLEDVCGRDAVLPAEMRAGHVFRQPWMREVVTHFLAATDAPSGTV